MAGPLCFLSEVAVGDDDDPLSPYDVALCIRNARAYDNGATTGTFKHAGSR